MNDQIDGTTVTTIDETDSGHHVVMSEGEADIQLRDTLHHHQRHEMTETIEVQVGMTEIETAATTADSGVRTQRTTTAAGNGIGVRDVTE
jgi:hypothetical protein